ALGPQRLVSLTPDTNAATPSPWRSLAWSDPTHSVRSARERGDPSLRDWPCPFQDGARGNHAGRDIPPQRNHELARHRHNPNPARSLPFPELLAVPHREGAGGLPAHPVQREMNADRLQPVIARATATLLHRRIHAPVGIMRSAHGP